MKLSVSDMWLLSALWKEAHELHGGRVGVYRCFPGVSPEYWMRHEVRPGLTALPPDPGETVHRSTSLQHLIGAGALEAKRTGRWEHVLIFTPAGLEALEEE